METKAIPAVAYLLLAVLGRTSAVARQDAPPSPPALAAAADAVTDSADTLEPPTVLLLNSGDVLQGMIREDDSGYFIRLKIGVKHVARRNVAGVFHSLEQAYRHQLARVPRNDPDERMKLALWCLEQKLTEQARQELETVLALNPENRRAKAMLFHLQARRAEAVDPQVTRTGATTEPEAPPGAPRELSSTTLDRLREAHRQQPTAEPPDIFNLPAPLAVRRYEEFLRFVHPELQNHCARCHDAELHTGAFRLYRTRTRRDLSNDLIGRANLEATLQLVEPNDLARSKLLSAAALTHPPDGRPVLGGPKHPSYRVLANWVASLKDPASGTPNQPAAPARYEPVPSGFEPPPTEGFAVGRTPEAARAQPAGPSRPPTPVESLAGAPVAGTPRVVSGGMVQGSVSSPAVPADAHFPEPGLLPRPVAPAPSGAIPPAKLPAAPPPQPDPGVGSGKPNPTPAGSPGLATLPDGTPALRLPSGELVPYVSSEALRKTPAEGDEDPAKKAVQAGERKARIDRDALQKFMQQRNAK
ncbi:MAG: hypothetical protein KatS3mg108_0609 [Isosphaeraceae bacterium]|jgi:hypothetical protein|nr:MAG: hypothetical protein KatS3mg108_0609 [Isosphaeraceae bacterium]